MPHESAYLSKRNCKTWNVRLDIKLEKSFSSIPDYWKEKVQSNTIGSMKLLVLTVHLFVLLVICRSSPSGAPCSALSSLLPDASPHGSPSTEPAPYDLKIYKDGDESKAQVKTFKPCSTYVGELPVAIPCYFYAIVASSQRLLHCVCKIMPSLCMWKWLL